MANAYDFLIVGQGIAGTVLSYTLLQKGKRVLVIASPRHSAATRVAAGLFNPITGKQLKKTWLAEELFPFLQRFYPEMEKTLGMRFFYPTVIYRPYRSVQEQNDWMARSTTLETWLRTDTDDTFYRRYTPAPYGGLETLHAGYVDTNLLLDRYADYLRQREALRDEVFDYSRLEILAEGQGVRYGQYRARYLIFCEGAHGRFNPFFQKLPFNCVKGEILDIALAEPLPFIINQGVSVIPAAKEGHARVAATYQWNPLDEIPTAQAREELCQKTQNLLTVSFQITGQKAGIRPATRPRRPFVGLHPQYPALGIFNGMGSKGISLAPFFAQKFYEYIENRKPLHEEVNISKYFSKQ
ncbi:glycine/D-amino acid oxidase-like deaminating enzyme [Thermonema lapsum]|uniref:Glycine/D-amino acid oxidase-like deaminating enzyme n=1 Tax=Thermonema lapsum TaxID=28195 RepID=A0A846MMZ1_9BACT|nr:FAD-dependent oxidoreductase [Thermonema lapsum]NIK72737.1 glycine/D-amino acid oxidase-like deaminating enzyme [Thermonema lapsum]